MAGPELKPLNLTGVYVEPLGDNTYYLGSSTKQFKGAYLGDDAAILFGGVASLLWETADANANALVLALPAGGVTDVPVLAIGDASILNKDLALFNGVTVPTVAIFDASETNRLVLDGTPAISSNTSITLSPGGVSGALVVSSDGTVCSLIPATGDYLRIGDAGTTSHSLAANDDLFVSGILEVDGAAYLDSSLTVAAGITMGTSITPSSNSGGIYARNADNAFFYVYARDNSVGPVEVARFQGAADPYLQVGRDDVNVGGLTGQPHNAVCDMLVIQAGAGTENEAAGFGAGVAFNLGNAASQVEKRGYLNCVLATATDGSEDANFVFGLMDGGVAPAAVLTLAGADKSATFAGNIFAANMIRIASGDLVAGNANAFMFAWQNPEASAITVLEVILDITTAGGTAGSLGDVGSAADATTHSNDMISGADLNAVAMYSSNRCKLDAKGGATDYITGQILTANAAGLVGRYYVMYVLT